MPPVPRTPSKKEEPGMRRLIPSILALVMALAGADLAHGQPPAFITAWGSFGSGDGQFGIPFGIAVGNDGTVYVTESDNGLHNCRVQRFTNEGTYLGSWGTCGA